jgi:hypothetical protein
VPLKIFELNPRYLVDGAVRGELYATVEAGRRGRARGVSHAYHGGEQGKSGRSRPGGQDGHMKRILLAPRAGRRSCACRFLLRPRQAAVQAADETLVVITPHNEALRYEFGYGLSRMVQGEDRQNRCRGLARDWRHQ